MKHIIAYNTFESISISKSGNIHKFGKFSDKFIIKTPTNPSMLSKGIKNYLDKKSDRYKYIWNKSRTTSSQYFEITDNKDNEINIRVSNHSPAINNEDNWSGISVNYYDDYILLKIDTSVGFKTSDIIGFLNAIDNSIELVSKITIDGKNLADNDKRINSYISELLSDKTNNEYEEMLSMELLKDIFYTEMIHNKEYKQHKENIKKEFEKSLYYPISIYNASNGVIIHTNNTIKFYLWNIDYSNLDLFGSENKKRRKNAKDKAIEELRRKIEDDKKTFENNNFSLVDMNKSKLTKKQQIQIHTKEFKEWFGDWENDSEHASKVVDDNGFPLICYHGTYGDFSEFEPPIKQMATKTKRKQPIFFSTDPKFASGYATAKDGNVLPVYLKINKIFDTNNISNEIDDYFYTLIYDKSISDGYSHDVASEHAYQWTKQLSYGSWGIMESDEMYNYLIDNNYDGFKTFEFESINYAVFNPTQIKSAIGNNGKFDKNNNNINETHNTI